MDIALQDLINKYIDLLNENDKKGYYNLSPGPESFLVIQKIFKEASTEDISFILSSAIDHGMTLFWKTKFMKYSESLEINTSEDFLEKLSLLEGSVLRSLTSHVFTREFEQHERIPDIEHFIIEKEIEIQDLKKTVERVKKTFSDIKNKIVFPLFYLKTERPKFLEKMRQANAARKEAFELEIALRDAYNSRQTIQAGTPVELTEVGTRSYTGLHYYLSEVGFGINTYEILEKIKEDSMGKVISVQEGLAFVSKHSGETSTYPTNPKYMMVNFFFSNEFKREVLPKLPEIFRRKT